MIAEYVPKRRVPYMFTKSHYFQPLVGIDAT